MDRTIEQVRASVPKRSWLLWLVVNITSGKWSPANIGLAIAACVSAVLINVTRIGLIGYFPDRLDLIYGEVGGSIAGLLSILAITAVSWLAVRLMPSLWTKSGIILLLIASLGLKPRPLETRRVACNSL